MTPQNEIGPPSSSEQIQVRPEASTSADAPNAQQDPLVQCTHILDVPLKIEDEVASMKLAAMGIRIDRLSAEQKQYLASWQSGT